MIVWEFHFLTWHLTTRLANDSDSSKVPSDHITVTAAASASLRDYTTELSVYSVSVCSMDCEFIIGTPFSCDRALAVRWRAAVEHSALQWFTKARYYRQHAICVSVTKHWHYSSGSRLMSQPSGLCRQGCLCWNEASDILLLFTAQPFHVTNIRKK